VTLTVPGRLVAIGLFILGSCLDFPRKM
jgi:hypothetical protein